jgi:hypothetical protein
MLLGLASADCERLGFGLFSQPVNSASSLVFLIAGGWILWRARTAPARRVELIVYAVAVASNAVGGVLYHGLQWPASKWIHDVSVLSVLVFFVVFDLSRRLDRPTRWTMEVYAAVLAGLGLMLALMPAIADAFFVVFAAVVAGGELLEYRHELPALRTEGLTVRRAARLGVIAVLALAGTAFLIGRTGAPFCAPGSAFQWHAVWHVLAAAAMALYAHGVIEPHPSEVRS